MPKVICNCTACRYNVEKLCIKDAIILEEDDETWKDCGGFEERKPTHENGRNN